MEHLDPELLSAYVDAELTPAEMAQVARHLASCGTCRREYEELRGMATLVRELPVYRPRREIAVEAPPPAMSPTLARIIEFGKPLAVAALILLVAIAGLRLLTDIGDEAPEDGDQISFSAVQETPAAGTEAAERASDTTAAQAPAAAEGPQAFPDADSADQEVAEMSEAAPAMMQQATQAPTAAPAPTVTPAPVPVAGDGGSDPLTVAIVVAAVALVGAAAAWYMLFRSPRGGG